MTAKTIIITSLLLIFFSCKQEKIAPDFEESENQFNIPCTTGSYWIYEWHSIDSNGIETSYGALDSIYISGDTIINNLDYTVYKGTWLGNKNYIHMQRDSSGFAISHRGIIQYSYDNFNDTLTKGSVSTMWNWHLQMFNHIDINVPAGVFNSIEARKYYYDQQGGSANKCKDDYFTLSSWYVDGIGKVEEKTGFSNDLFNCRAHLESRLIRYHIAE